MSSVNKSLFYPGQICPTEKPTMLVWLHSRGRIHELTNWPPNPQTSLRPITLRIKEFAKENHLGKNKARELEKEVTHLFKKGELNLDKLQFQDVEIINNIADGFLTKKTAP